MSAKLSSAALVRRLYRKFQTNERGFLSRLFSLLFSFSFFFLFYLGAGLRPRLNSRTLEKSMLRLSIFRSTKGGNIDDVLRARGRISIALRLLHFVFLNSHDVI